MALALFDLDNTLIAGDSDHAWGEFMIEQGLVDGEHFRSQNDRFYEDYRQGRLDIFAYLHFVAEPLTRLDAEALKQLHQAFMISKVEPMQLPRAEALLEEHRQAGDTLVIITATNSFVTAPIAQALGVEHLIATELERIEGRFTGRVAGTPSFREGKVTRLLDWLEVRGENLTDSHFYSDSFNDLPLLEQVSRPVVVDGDASLRQIAEQRGWEQISLRYGKG